MTSLLRRGGLLQCPRPGAEARVERYWGFAGIADRVLDFFEITRGEIVPLFEVDALCRGIPGRVGGDGVECCRQPSNEVGELALMASDFFEFDDQIDALAVAFVEQPAKGERQAPLTIARQAPRESGDRL